MCFYFYSSLLHLKPIFLPSPQGGNTKLPNWNQRAWPGGYRFFLALSRHSFLWQVLEHSCRLKFMPLGQVKQTLMGDTNKCFYKKTTSRPRFYAESHQFIIKGTLGESRKCVPLYVGDRKRQYFSLKPSHSMLLKGKSGMHNEI